MKRSEIERRLVELESKMANLCRDWRRKNADKEKLTKLKDEVRAERKKLQKKLRRKEFIKYSWPTVVIFSGAAIVFTGMAIATVVSVMPGVWIMVAGVWFVNIGAIAGVLS